MNIMAFPQNNAMHIKRLRKAYEPTQIYGQTTSPTRFKITYCSRQMSIPRPITSPKMLRPVDLKFAGIPSLKISSLESWKSAYGVCKSSQVFIIQGEYPDLKNSLIERGWVENPDPNSPYFNLLWTRSAKMPAKLQDWQVINHFPKNFEVSAKWNFCENLKKLKKISNIDCSKFYPRCFRMFGKEYEEFQDFFKAYKALSILKMHNRLKGSYEKLLTALNVCKRLLHFLEKDIKIDHSKSLVLIHSSEWKVLNSASASEAINEFYRFNAGKTLLHESSISEEIEETLKRLEIHDPQFHLCGQRNIWIVKPGRKSRGRDIMVSSSLEDIKTCVQNLQQWVVQKYIENPLLIHNKKFDIRQWVLVSNSDPLTIWVYTPSYLRFTVENYDVGNLNNLYSHLTNNSISKNSIKFNRSEIEGCMWSIGQFISYLNDKFEKDYWKESIFPRIKDIIKWSLLSAGYLGRKNCFELFGYDFMIDQNLTPWLLEVNSSPAMDYSTVIIIQSTTSTLVREVLTDVSRLLTSNFKESGKFIMIYKAKSSHSLLKS